MSDPTPNTRLEAFCDGVFAIAITLLIIEIRLPTTPSISTTAEFWTALRHIGPSIFAFVLSFGIIFITWVNHHAALKLVKKSSNAFVYANGFLLLWVVFLPFPTALLGEHLFTDHAAPAVILFSATQAFQSVGWILIGITAIRNGLGKSEEATRAIRRNFQFGSLALPLYTACAVVAIWLPLPVAILTTLIWIFWLVWGINIKHDKVD